MNHYNHVFKHTEDYSLPSEMLINCRTTLAVFLAHFSNDRPLRRLFSLNAMCIGALFLRKKVKSNSDF